VLFANVGLRVHGVDVSESVVQKLTEGRPHILEPGLDLELSSAIQSGLFTASLSPVCAETFIISVPTPCRPNHEPDISMVESAVRSVAPYLQPGNLIILESTSPVGTSEHLAEIVLSERPDLAVAGLPGCDRASERLIFIAHCPERVLPGTIMRELVENDRVVGGLDLKASALARALYARAVKGAIHITSAKLAELSKLTENAFRDVNIAFANELSLICDRLHIDVWDLISLANLHPRVNILNPGPGVGGHCIAVDPWFIVHSDPEQAKLVRQAREINDRKSDWVAAKTLDLISKHSRQPVVACLGLSYKPDVDDLRESPSIKVIEKLLEKWSGKLLIVEPYIQLLPTSLSHLAELVDLEAALGSADVVVGLVAHSQFQAIDRTSLIGKTILDTCGIWR
jgi:UDP-N-acetyl-D-mannosaminuronic acid dehydrogenase